MASAEEKTGPAEPSAEYDLTQNMAPFLDLHMLFPMLEWLREQGSHPEQELIQAQKDLASKTAMIQYELGFADELSGTERTEDMDWPDWAEDKKEQIIERYTEFATVCKPLIGIKDDEAKLTELRTKGAVTVTDEEGVTTTVDATTLEKLYGYCRFGMDMGNYGGVKSLLLLYRQCITDREKSLAALWGQLAASIRDIEADYQVAAVSWDMLKENVDKARGDGVSHLLVLQQRTFLIHWGLFIFFRIPDAEGSSPKSPKMAWAKRLCDMFFPQQAGGNRWDDSLYMTVVRTNCPWILRYISAAVIMQRQRGSKEARQNSWRQGRRMSDFVRVLRAESDQYADPITNFLKCLYHDYDLIGAKDMLAKCEAVVRSDFFLHNEIDEENPEQFVKAFMECAREMWLEMFCDVHHKIDLRTLAAQLDLDIEEAEKWMVDLILSRETEGTDPKIDREAGQIVMGKTFPSIYQTVINKYTKDLLRRSLEMQNTVVAAYSKQKHR